MSKKKRRLKAAKRVKAGNGRSLKPFHWWQMLSRSLFYLPMMKEDGRQTVFAVDVPYWEQFFSSNADKGKAHLYFDGKHCAESKLPAVFPVDGGWIEVQSTVFGLKRCHFVTDEGLEYQLTPDESSTEGRRARLDRGHPALSRWIRIISLMMVIIPIVLAAPQIIDIVTHVPPIAERFGTFNSPIALSKWFNMALGLCAAAGSIERATRLKWSAFLDGNL